MMMLFIATLLSMLAISAHAALPAVSTPPTMYPSSAFKHLEPVTDFRVVHSEMHLESTIDRFVDGHHQPLPDKVTVEFTVFGVSHSYELEITQVFAPYMTLKVVSDEGEEEVSPTSRSYHKDLPGGDWVTATINEDGTMHAAIAMDGELLQIDPLSVHQAELHRSVFHQLSQQHVAPHGMVAVRGSDMIEEGDNTHLCGVVDKPETEHLSEQGNATFAAEPRGAARRLLTVDPWTDCRSPWVKLKLYTGVAVDFGFYKAVGGTVAKVNAYLAQMYATMNKVYTLQLNEVLWIQDAIIMTTTSNATYPWNQDRLTKTCATIGDTLVTLTTWRRAKKPTQQGQWALVTDCYPPPGTTGIAYLNGLCSARLGTSVSTFTSTTWVTLAHELGHNHNAAHTFQLGKGTTGGIMDYGNGKLNGEYQFYRFYTEPEMCPQIMKALSKTTRTNLVPYDACWAPYSASCGNGIVEDGEDCDESASGCCDTTTCRFKAGAQCISNGDCCRSCKFEPTTTTCNPLPAVSGGGYCGNGVCKTPICPSFGIPFCGVDPTNSCKMKCYIKDTCNTMAGYTSSKTGLPIATTIADGTVCDISPYSTCQTGICKSTSVTTTVTYGWVSGAWSSCPVTCGSGTLTRTVSCQDSNKNVVSTSLCTATKPATSMACSGLPVCPSFSWRLSSFSTCTKDCGTGSQTATLTCVSNTGLTVSSTNCALLTKPATTRSCNTAACGVSWSVGEWSTCTKACGSGIQTRTITCVQTQNSATVIVANSFCSALASPGATSRTCNTGACGTYDWVFGVWSKCSRTCDTGQQTRTIECRSSTTGGVVSSSLCTSQPPITIQVCATNRCPVYQWYMTPWSACSTSCGGGRRTRLVYCMNGATWTLMDDAMCPTQKPAAIETCSTSACPSALRYDTSAWTTCTATCGGGTFTRTVQCVDENKAARNDTECESFGLTVPDFQGDCNLQACPTYSWFITSTGACSATLGCGGGTQNRVVVCMKDGSSTIVNSNLCDASSKPSENLACNTETCGTYNWRPNEWSECSVACGTGGLRSRSVSCMSMSGVIADNSMCDASSMVATEETCNSHTCPVYWYTGPYGECSSVCGTGEKTRSVECHDTSSDVIVDSSRCTDAMPSSNSTCNTQSCPQWYASEWSDCSTRCNDGIQNRSLECRDVDGFVVDEMECTSDAPSETQPCNLMPCPHWHQNDWGDCSAVCDGGIQTRTTACRMPHDDPVWKGAIASDASLCPDEIDIPLTQECNTEPCTDYYWKPTYQACPVNCGGGLQDAIWECINSTSETHDEVVDGVNCVGTPDSALRTCNTQPCPVYDWYLLAGDVWSQCSSGCGVGLEKREVVCANTVGVISLVNFEVANDSMCADKVMPARTRVCTQPSCANGGMCIMGKCTCRSGFHGDYCDQQPQLGMVMTNAALFSSAGIPSGEQLLLRWPTSVSGALNQVSLLITRPSWPFPVYIVADIANTGEFLWTVPTTLEPAADYTVITWFSPLINNQSQHIPIADPCAYRSCGQYGYCNKGRCECVLGYSGEACTLSPCAAAGCNVAHSNCTLQGVCECGDGYSGPQCMTPPSCDSSICKNKGYVTDGDVAGECSDCICPNYWTGSDCGTCSLQCQNGFSPDADCRTCQCGDAESGYFGDYCECKFAIGKMTIRSQDLTWISDTSIDGARWRFNDTVERDLSSAIPGTEPRHFEVLDVSASGADVVVRFQIKQECGTTAAASDALFGRRLLQAGITYIGVVPPVANITASIRQQLADPRSDLYRGVITSGASAEFSVEDPSGIAHEPTDGTDTPTQPPTPPAPIETSALLPLWAWIVAGAGAVLLIGGSITFFCVRKRANARAQEAKMKQAAAEPPAKSPTAKSPTSSAETPLPEGWTQQTAPDGQIYYFHAATGVSEWTRPSAPATTIATQ